RVVLGVVPRRAEHARETPRRDDLGHHMPLFIVRHEHDAERCPATDPYMGATLLNYLSRPTVRAHGIEIHGEAVVQGEHTLYMIVEAASDDRVRAFMRPFAEAGTVDVYPASTCVRVVASGGCAASMPLVDRKSTRLNSSHQIISYAVFCLKKKKTKPRTAGEPVLGPRPVIV